MTDHELSTHVDEETKYAVRFAANANDMTISEWVAEAIEEKLKEEDFSGGPGPSGPAGFT